MEMNIEEEVRLFREKIDQLQQEIGRVIVGHKEVVLQIISTLLSRGHALIEGVPGLGKTLLVRTLSQALDLSFSRIQFTPDLMPADIIGTNIIVEDENRRRSFRFQPGPIFGNIVLADEINRATPKTQSALLEVMQEYHVTVAGKTHPLREPFAVLATQNPIEMEGTYPLPEAQLDRFFFKIKVSPSPVPELVEVLRRTTGREEEKGRPMLKGEEILRLRDLVRGVPIATPVLEYVARVIHFSSPNPGKDKPLEIVKKYVRYGSSPRGGQALVVGGKVLALLKGRFNVSFKDVRETALPALRHRLILNFEGEAEGIDPDEIISGILKNVPERPKEVERLLSK